MEKRLYFANDTSTYHGGSWAASQVIRDAAVWRGWSVVTERLKNRVEMDAIGRCDAVLVNGEGTLHSNKPRARHLLCMLRWAQEQGKATALCNASWFGMNNEFDDVLRRLDNLCVRDAFSLAALREVRGLDPQLHLDLSYQHPLRARSISPRKGWLVTDFYAREFDCFAWPTGGPMAEFPRIDMRAMTWQQVLDAVASTDMFITGRFHGMMAALRARTRFVSFPGNTEKIAGVLALLDADRTLEREFRKLKPTAFALASNESFYSELFGRLDSFEPWCFPFT